MKELMRFLKANVYEELLRNSTSNILLHFVCFRYDEESKVPMKFILFLLNHKKFLSYNNAGIFCWLSSFFCFIKILSKMVDLLL